MGSLESDHTDTERASNSNSTDTDDDEETQPIRSDTQPIESENEVSDELECTMPFGDTLPMGDTQEMEDPDCIGTDMTLVLESDGEGTDRTEVLSVNEESSDDDSGKRGADEVMKLEKKSSGVSESGFVADSVASAKENCGSGSVCKSFMSVRASALRASGLAASRKASPAENLIQDNKMGVVRDTAMDGMQGKEVSSDVDAENYNGDTEGSRIQRKGKAVSSAVRKLFAEDAFLSNTVLAKDNDIIDEDCVLPEFGDKPAGLSYVLSQEPGEMSQDNALNIVDKFLLVNDVEMFQDGSLVKLPKEKSPPVSSAKGSLVLAQRPSLRSPVGKAGIFDWDDRCEDERGGDFFSKNKESIFGSGSRARGSSTDPQKPKQHHSKRGRGSTINKLGKGKESLNIHQKIVGLTRSDSRLLVQSSKEDGKILNLSKIQTRKNLFEEMDKQLSPKTSEQQLKATDMSKETVNEYDVGIDTQMAAEAMEALVCGGPAKCNIDVTSQATPNATKDFTGGVMRKKARMKQTSIQKRSSTSGGVSTRSRKRKMLNTDIRGQAPVEVHTDSNNQITKEFVSESGNKAQKRKSVAEQNLSSGNTINGIKSSGRRSSQSARQIKAVTAMQQANTIEVKALDGEISFSQEKIWEDYITSTPVARRTRLSKNSEGKSLFNDTKKSTNDLMKKTAEKRKRRSLDVDAAKPLNSRRKSSKLGFDQNADLRKDKPIQEEASDHGPFEKIPTENYEKQDVHRNSQLGTHHNMLDDSNEAVDLEAPPKTDNVEADEQSITKRKKMKVDIKTNAANFYTRKTRASVHCYPSSSSLKNRPERSMENQEVVEPVIADVAVNCFSDVVNEKIVPKDPVQEAISICSGRNDHLDLGEDEVDDLEAPSTNADRVEARGKSSTRLKGLEADIKVSAGDFYMRRTTRSSVHSLPSPSSLKVSAGNFYMRRKTRSSVHSHPSPPSFKKQPKGSMHNQEVVEPALAEVPVNCSSDVANEKMVPQDPVKAAVSKSSGRKCPLDSSPSAKGVEVNGISPARKVKQSGSTCVTPISCATPINAASPVCIGDGQSCRKSPSRTSLLRELAGLDVNEALHTSPFKELRKRKDMSQVRVLFSHHLDDDIIKQQKKILARLGASIACSSSEATHFVTNKFVRTRNMLEAIALGKPVVTQLWLETCGQASCYIDERNHILRDSKKEKEIGFSMPVSLAQAGQRPLLQNKKVFVTPNVKPGKELIASLVKAVRGQAVERIGRSVTKDEKVPDDLLVLSCEEDYKICVPLLERGAMVYSSELLLNGIVIQKLEYERHRLFIDHVRRTRSTIWLRKEKGDQFHPVTKRK